MGRSSALPSNRIHSDRTPANASSNDSVGMNARAVSINGAPNSPVAGGLTPLHKVPNMGWGQPRAAQRGSRNTVRKQRIADVLGMGQNVTGESILMS